ncbi:hypothetical protein CI238_06670 [Colletotrichum incanum]|uniref:Uncharacterized protein n=1 Tax=Colletotrichum incanum TaxID=1573173 RepID=A0A167B684_COLIC|nr:hypothetical protein CI238_06670 [Colletotrichum incanum]
MAAGSLCGIFPTNGTIVIISQGQKRLTWLQAPHRSRLYRPGTVRGPISKLSCCCTDRQTDRQTAAERRRGKDCCCVTVCASIHRPFSEWPVHCRSAGDPVPPSNQRRPRPRPQPKVSLFPPPFPDKPVTSSSVLCSELHLLHLQYLYSREEDTSHR